ncbi:MAG: hypothetical protein RLZZ399_1593 [Verrucomicrobiota bacterium]
MPNLGGPRGFGSLSFSAELFFQLQIAHLDHGGTPMGATIRQIAGQQVFEEAGQFGFAQRVVCFDGVPAHGFGNHVLSQPQSGAEGVGVTEFVNDVVEKLRRVVGFDEGG